MAMGAQTNAALRHPAMVLQVQTNKTTAFADHSGAAKYLQIDGEGEGVRKMR